MPPGLLPWSGSVKPKDPIHSPLANFGKNFWRWASFPYFQIGYITNDDCTEAVERTPESPRSISCMIRP